MTADFSFNSCDTDLIIVAGNSAAVVSEGIAAESNHAAATGITAVVGGILGLGRPGSTTASAGAASMRPSTA